MKEVYEGDEDTKKIADPWETISNGVSANNVSVATDRMRVAGGWLYRSVSRMDYPQSSALAMVFIPSDDPFHDADGGMGAPAGVGEPRQPFTPPEAQGYDCRS